MDAEGHLFHLGTAHDITHDEAIEATGIIGSIPDQPLLDTVEHPVIDEVLQYAYQSNLITDHLMNPFSLAHLFGDLIRTTIPPIGDDGFTDPTHLTELEVPDIVLRENLSLPDSACRLICEAYHIPKDEEVEELSRSVLDSDRVRCLRVELPILRSDNDWAVRKFKRDRLARLRVSIKDHNLPMDTPDSDAGEGMQLHENVRSESELLLQKTEGEKLGVTKGALIFLADQLKVDITRDDLMNYLIGEVKCNKNSILKKVTPPVSPKLGQKHFIPSAGACLIPMPSDESLLDENFRAIEDAMLADYQDQWSEITSPVRELLETEYSIQDGMSLLQDSKSRLDDLKVEVPLMLDSVSAQPVTSSEDSFKALSLKDLDLDPEFEMAFLRDFPDGFLGENFQSIADETARSVEQEQLQQIDAVARVPIPVMDFSSPQPDWVQLQMNEKCILKFIQAGKEELFEPPHWPIHKADESKLVWTPLGTCTSLIPADENMDDGERLVEAFIKVPQDTELLTSADFVHRASHFAVLQNDDEDEEIETLLAEPKPQKDLIEIVRKRPHDGDVGIAQKKPRHIIREPSSGPSMRSDGQSLLLVNSSGMSGKLLANFMEIHAAKKKWTQSRYFVSHQNESADDPAAGGKKTFSKSSERTHGQQSRDLKTSSKSFRIKAPYPETVLPTIPLTVFVSIRIPRRLIRTLEDLVPGLTMIERDYDAYNTSVWRPGSVARSVVVSPMVDDADITVSPSTGLIITNMIRIRQKPRLGTNKGMVQTRIEKASVRYGDLVVLIGGEGGIEDSLLQMSPSDSAALTELQGFASGLGCHVKVQYIGGGDSTLVRWVAFCICKYGNPDHGLQTNLLELETIWELFLRRAGLNVYAAQAVVSQLKPLGLDDETGQPEKHGLGAFVTMTRAERLHRFGQLISPRVLERVSAAVDEVWN